MRAEPSALRSSQLSFGRASGDTLVLALAGDWHLEHGLISGAALERELAHPPMPRRIAFDAAKLGQWDSSLVAFVAEVLELCHTCDLAVDPEGLPGGLRRLIELAEAVPEAKDAYSTPARAPLVERVGAATIAYTHSIGGFVAFLGAVTIALGRFMVGRARYRRVDLMVAIQDCGANAFGIVTLISFLVGTILAFMGAVQLEQFGASIFVADLVGIGMARDMGAMMTAIIMAGRTGAAFAAQLGTMKVTQEIDALSTMGISPMEFLVLPRVIALILMMPLLCFYSDLMGVLGGAAVGSGVLGLSFTTYFRETLHAVTLGDVLGGVFKSSVYGVIIAISGCLRGFQCGNNSSAVGDAATSAVVTGIVFIVVACGSFALVFNILGF
ncbi:MAG TPA: ABC transporter permease [Candidatus Binataceae bacterium]|nr:ABC transporter permease [Candidatus Binataceae bacterium]